MIAAGCCGGVVGGLQRMGMQRGVVLKTPDDMLKRSTPNQKSEGIDGRDLLGADTSANDEWRMREAPVFKTRRCGRAVLGLLSNDVNPG
jgi:hypothetical protein